MSLTLTNSSTQSWIRPIGLTATAFGGQSNVGTGWTFAAWIRINSTGISALGANMVSIVGLGSPTSDAFMGTFVDQYNGIYVDSISDGFSSGQYAAAGNYSSGVWCLILGQFPNSGQQSFYASINGDTLTANTSANNDPTTLTNLAIGFSQPGTGFGGTNTSSNLINIAEVTVWRGLLSFNEYALLRSGANPMRVRKDILQYYYPLRGNLQDYGPQQIGLQPQGGAVAVYADHPPVQNMPMRTAQGFTPNYAYTYYGNYPF